MRTARGKKIAAALVAGGFAFAAAACGDAPTPTPSSSGPTTPHGDYATCMVTDTGGIDDRSFNASSFQGLVDAANDAPDVFAEPVNVASDEMADYEPNLTNYAQGECDFVLAVGGLMGGATETVATAYPEQQFAIVDSGSALPNVYSLQFDTVQAAFLAGYLAAGYSESGVVGTYGGLNIPPVTIFMDGFADGVTYYNEQKGTDVQVLGWDKATQTGAFSESFTDQDAGAELANTLHAQGADVIMPVAGGTGLGTAAAAQTSGEFVVIWVDVDGCVAAEQYCDVFLSSVGKNMQLAVATAAQESSEASGVLGTDYIGTLENNGVYLAPYHEFDSQINSDLKAEIENIKAAIISGDLEVSSPSSPV